MRRGYTDSNQDMVNVLLIVLKFILLIIIGLQGIRSQLGMSISANTGVVNTTPEIQTTTNGRIAISYYPVIYVPGKDFRDVPFQLQTEVWQCHGECSDDWSDQMENSCQWNPGDSGDHWRRLEDIPQSTAPVDYSYLRDLRSSEAIPIRNLYFNLIGQAGAPPEQGVYTLIYRVQFDMEDHTTCHWKRSNGGGFLKVDFRSNEAGPWLLAPVKIVRGRSGELHPFLAGFELRAAGEVFQINSSSNRVSLRRRGRPGDEPRLQFQVMAEFQQKEGDGTLSVSGTPIGRIATDEDTAFLRYDPERNTYVAGRPDELRQAMKVFYRLRLEGESQSSPPLAAEIRYGPQVYGSMPVLILENRPPRSVYRGQGGRYDRQMLWYFPYDTFREDGRWWFDLSRWVVDPDGEDGILLEPRNFRPGTNWLSSFQIQKDPHSPSAQLVFDPDEVLRIVTDARDHKFTFQASDGEMGWVEFEVELRVLRAQTLVSDSRRIRRVLGQ